MIFERLIEPKPTQQSHAPPIGEPGVLEQLAERAGLAPERAGEVEEPYGFPDHVTLERTLLATTPVYGVEPEPAGQVVRRTVQSAAEPYKRPDGSYRFQNLFRYLIAVAA